MGTTAETLGKGPTTATLRLIEDVLRRAAMPMSRYQVRKQLGNRVSQPTLDAALEYLSEHDLVYDEGPGGKALWIHAPADVHSRL